MTPLERAAMALHDTLRDKIVEFAVERGMVTEEMARKQRPPWTELPVHMRHPWMEAARTVLTAIREPGDEAFQAGVKLGRERGTVIAWGDYGEFWQAMIDALMTEAPSA